MDKYLIQSQINEIGREGYFCSDINLNEENSSFIIRLNCSFKNKISFSNKIKICVPKEYPALIPKIYDINNIIPREYNYHCSQNGELCLEAPINLYSKFRKHKTLYFFIVEFIIPFYYNFHYKKKYLKYPYGEYSHGLEGEIEALKEYLGIKNSIPLEKFMALFYAEIVRYKILPYAEIKKISDLYHKLSIFDQNNIHSNLFIYNHIHEDRYSTHKKKLLYN